MLFMHSFNITIHPIVKSDFVFLFDSVSSPLEIINIVIIPRAQQ